MGNDWEPTEHTDEPSEGGAQWLVPEPLRYEPGAWTQPPEDPEDPEDTAPSSGGHHVSATYRRYRLVAVMAIAGLATTGAGIGIGAKIASASREGGTGSLPASS